MPAGCAPAQHHRRDHGHQPLAGCGERVTVVQNGEIYNHAELRAQLVSRGHAFRTRCDTEVLAHAYEEWGDAFLRRLRGMFALALWDRERQRLPLARDRFGIKPLSTQLTAAASRSRPSSPHWRAPGSRATSTRTPSRRSSPSTRSRAAHRLPCGTQAAPRASARLARGTIPPRAPLAARACAGRRRAHRAGARSRT